jgi:hypothetical protein
MLHRALVARVLAGRTASLFHRWRDLGKLSHARSLAAARHASVGGVLRGGQRDVADAFAQLAQILRASRAMRRQRLVALSRSLTQLRRHAIREASSQTARVMGAITACARGLATWTAHTEPSRRTVPIRRSLERRSLSEAYLDWCDLVARLDAWRSSHAEWLARLCWLARLAAWGRWRAESSRLAATASLMLRATTHGSSRSLGAACLRWHGEAALHASHSLCISHASPRCRLPKMARRGRPACISLPVYLPCISQVPPA